MHSLSTTTPDPADATTIPEPVLWRWVLDHRSGGTGPANPTPAPLDARRLPDPIDLIRPRPTIDLDAAPRRAVAADEHDEGETGQATAEYALVLLGAAAIALL